MLLTGCQKPAIIGVPAREYCMKTKGSTSYTGVTLGELKKYFTDDAVIEVSKKFLNAHKMIAGESHMTLTVQKEEPQPQIEAKETQLEEEPAKKEEPSICHSLTNW